MRTFVVVLRKDRHKAPSSATLKQPTYDVSQHSLKYLYKYAKFSQGISSHDEFLTNILYLRPTFQRLLHFITFLVRLYSNNL